MNEDLLSKAIYTTAARYHRDLPGAGPGSCVVCHVGRRIIFKMDVYFTFSKNFFAININTRFCSAIVIGIRPVRFRPAI